MTLAARSLALSYGRHQVLRGLDFELAPGEVVALLGPNGSGKSTFLRALARLLRPTAGVVELDGRTLAEWSPASFARRVALLTQTHEPAAELTVRELVTLGRHPHQGFFSLPGPGDRAAVEAALEQTDLTALADRRMGELSGGEAQRSWFALALAQEPEILLLDEPTTFLDLAHQLAVLDLIRRLNEARRLTVVMALHDLGQASRYADRVAVLRDGELLADGSPAEVLTAPVIRAAYAVDVEIVRGASGIAAVIPVRAANT